MKHRDFWNREYKTGEHLALSKVAAEDLQKFTRWLLRNHKREFLNVTATALDLGSGNGRNLVYLAQEFGVRGVGYDISDVAIQQAEDETGGLPIQYEVRSIHEKLPLPDESVTLVLDMMTSHFLKQAEREALRAEILRVLKPGGWLFFKSFLADQDDHTKRLLREHPADEKGAYIHPVMGVYEYAWTEQGLEEFFGSDFDIAKIEKSHKHRARGCAYKRRTISAYLHKKHV